MIGNLPDVSTMPELTACLRVSRNTIRRALATGELRGNKVGRAWRFFKSDVEKWIESGTTNIAKG